MFNILLITLSLLMSTSANYHIDFGNSTGGQDWQVVNDRVMGGLSEGQVKLTNNSLTFIGNLSLENNGGFASVRAPFKRTDFSTYKTVTVRYRSVGPMFALSMELDRRFYVPNYKHYLEGNNGEWQEETYTLTNFQEHRIGVPTGRKMETEQMQNIIRIGFITLDKKKAGPFELEIDYIKFQ